MKAYRDRFLQFLSLERNASANTIASYRLDVDRYLRYLCERGVSTPEEVTEDHTAGFLRSLHDQGLSPRSVTRAISAVRGFHKFLVGDEVYREFVYDDARYTSLFHLPGLEDRAILLDGPVPAGRAVFAVPTELYSFFLYCAGDEGASCAHPGFCLAPEAPAFSLALVPGAQPA